MSVSVVIPARNEENTIQQIIKAAYPMRPKRIIVSVDADTDDRTFINATLLTPYFENLTVIGTAARGKGQVVKAGLNHVDTDRVVFLDADVTGWYSDNDPAMQCLFSDIAQMVIVIPKFPTREELKRYGSRYAERAIMAWPHVSGLRSVPTEMAQNLELHGYLMETQLNITAKEQGLSVWYQWAEHLHSPFRLNRKRLDEMERDRTWGIKNGVLDEIPKG